MYHVSIWQRNLDIDRLYTIDRRDATRAATPATIMAACVSLCPVPEEMVTWDILKRMDGRPMTRGR
jgi:hypothetical protein